MDALKSTPGHRARSHSGHSFSELKSALQKAVRRGLAEEAEAHAAQILSVVLHGHKAKGNFTNALNRLLVILSEDVGDYRVPEKLEPFIEKLIKIRKGLDQQNSPDIGETSAAFFNAVRLLAGSKFQSRSVSSVKAVLIESLKETPSTLLDVHLPGVLAQKMEFDILSAAKPLFHSKFKTKNGSVNKDGKRVVEVLWQKIISAGRYHPLLKSVQTLYRIWKGHFNHKESFLWPIHAMLLILQTKTDTVEENLAMLSAQEAQEVFWGFMEKRYTLPAYASDMHTGKFSKTSEEGMNNFLFEGLKLREERHFVPEKWKDFYIASKLETVKKKSLKRKSASEESFPNKISKYTPKTFSPPLKVNGLQVKRYVLTQLPCGGKPTSWLVEDVEGNNWFVKNGASKPTFQLAVDSRKEDFGLVKSAFYWDDEESVLLGKDKGMGHPYSTKNHKGVTMLFDKERSAHPAKWVDKFTDKQIENILRIFAFRKVLGVSDSHLGNILVLPGTDDMLSVDEMTFKPRVDSPDCSFLDSVCVKMNAVRRKEFNVWKSKHGGDLAETLLKEWCNSVRGTGEKVRWLNVCEKLAKLD
jgi:hypothetical protein